MRNKSKDIAFVFVTLLVAYLTYAQLQHDDSFNRQVREIQSVRRALQDSVSLLKASTASRDMELRDLILRDMELIDTLNATLARLNKSSGEIDQKIKVNKKLIDQLWRENN